ncbi:MAG: DegT/DnrJ/EryC1/StrS family aminotransferase [Prosthecobacter sp.]
MSSRSAALFPFFPQEDERLRRGEIAEAVGRVLGSGSFILGREVAAFEQAFAEFLGADHAVGVGSGTDAIELMLRVLEIGEGDGVVVPANAPSAVAAGVMCCGARPVFADVERETLTLCPVSLEAVLRSPAGRGVRAALAVHLYGHPADWAGLERVAEAHGIALLEDAAQAHGAVWRGRMAGTLGRLAAFSFYPTKNLGACGDAGAVVTRDAALAERLRELRQYGWRRRGVSEGRGINSRMDEIQAAILRVKLPYLAEGVRRRRELAAVYASRLGGHPGPRLPVVRADCGHAFHLHVVRSDERDALRRRLEAAGVPVAIHYEVPLHRQPAFATGDELPVAEAAAGEVLTLPLHAHLTEEAVHAVCDAVEGRGDAGG